MLSISQILIDQMVAHSRQDHPDEACGVIAGPAGSDKPTRFIPMINSARSPTFMSLIQLTYLSSIASLMQMTKTQLLFIIPTPLPKLIRRALTWHMPQSHLLTMS